MQSDNTPKNTDGKPGNGFATIQTPCPNCGGVLHVHPQGRICGCDQCLKIFRYADGKVGQEVGK